MVADKPCVFDLNWFDLPDDVVATTLIDLLQESRRLPEVMIVITTSESQVMTRIVDVDAIKSKFDQLMEEHKAKRKEERDNDREEKLSGLKEGEKTEEEIEEEMAEWEEAQKAKDEEEDEEAPNYDNMVNAEKEQLHERYEKDKEFFDEFVEAIKAKQVPVLEFNGDQNPQQIFRRLTHQMVNFIEKRRNFVERYMC